MSEENKNKCAKCDVGKLIRLSYRKTERTGRKNYTMGAKFCPLCKEIESEDMEIGFHQK